LKDTLNSGANGVLSNNKFILAIGKELLSFSKVSNISKTLECETFTEGGLNTMVRTFIKPKQQQETLILEKGVNVSRKDNIDTYDNLKLKVGGRIRQAVTLVVLGDEGFRNKNLQVDDRYYSFDEGVVVKWEVGDLEALRSEIFIERFEIAHSGLKELKQTKVEYYD